MRILLITAGALALGTLGAAGLKTRQKFYHDDPVWTMPRPVAVVNATHRKLSDYYDFLENTLFPRGERASHKGDYLPSQGINTVDEVPDSAWYTNRHASRRMTLAELRKGPGDSNPPAPGAWTVIAAKNEGVTPGFRIRDAAGRQYLIKFDPLSNPEMASAADVITSKFLYALGYNVPENYVARFDRAQIAIGEGAMLRDETGKTRPIRERDIEDMLAKAPRTRDGQYRALASRLISGKPLGPFRYNGTRSDDPNDLVPHEHRRDLRGLRTFSAWLGHDDSRALNTLDLLVSENGVPFIKHYLIDFGASLGSATFQANSPRDGNVYLFDCKSSEAQFFSLGLYVPAWQRARYPNLPATGRFEYETFDPMRWVANYPNAAFHNQNPADGLWAARKIMAIDDEEIRAIVATGQYTDPAAEEWIARCLIERRKKIVNVYMTGMGALDGFEVRDGRLEFSNAGAGAVAIQWSNFDNDSGLRRLLPGERSFRLPGVSDGVEYVVAELTGTAAGSISVYVSMKPNPRIAGIERHFDATRRPALERQPDKITSEE
jgi:hypothetical protein